MHLSADPIERTDPKLMERRHIRKSATTSFPDADTHCEPDRPHSMHQ